MATAQWPGVAAAIRPLFGPNWHHEATHQAREKASTTRVLLPKAGRKGGQKKAKAKPQTTPAIGQAASQATSLDTSQATSLASPRLKPDALPRDGEASAQAGDQVPYPAIPDPEAASAWFLERDVFPADLDELQRLLMAGQLTLAILEPSAQ